MPQSDYAWMTTATTGTSTGAIRLEDIIRIDGTADSVGGAVSLRVTKQAGIAPQLYFKYIKKKFGTIEGMKLNRRLKALEKAFDKAVANGQDALAAKFLLEVSREAKESAIYAKGIKLFIEKADLDKHKRNIRGGHISDTQFKDFTRVIPPEVLAKKKKVEDVFDGFVIYHYWNEKAEEVRAGKQKMSGEEKAKMRDPVLFGWIKESNRLYYIADWEDEYCDLTFEEIADVLGKDESELTLPRDPQLVYDQERKTE